MLGGSEWVAAAMSAKELRRSHFPALTVKQDRQRGCRMNQRTTTQVNFTTIKGPTGRGRREASEYLEAKAERWINQKISEGWNLREVIPNGEESVHVVMVRKEQT